MSDLWMNVDTMGYVRKIIKPVFGVWMNVDTEGYVCKSFTPVFDLWMNIDTVGYVRSTKKEPDLTGSLELRIAGSMKKI